MMASSTAANTSRTLSVSVACVKPQNKHSLSRDWGKDRRNYTYCGFARFACMNLHKINLAALLMAGSLVYLGKYLSNGTYDKRSMSLCGSGWYLEILRLALGSLLLNMSSLFKNKIIEVQRNHLELIADSNKSRLSLIRFYFSHTGIAPVTIVNNAYLILLRNMAGDPHVKHLFCD
jgi:hypothetical protein